MVSMDAQEDRDDDVESPELIRFREEWREEVRQRKGARQTDLPSQNETSTLPTASSGSGKSDANQPTVRSPSHLGLTGARALTVSRGETQLGPTLARAVGIYRSAAQHEQQGLLDDALRLYRQAFRLDPNVDRAYFLEEQRSQQRATAPSVVGNRSHQKTASIEKAGLNTALNFSTTTRTVTDPQTPGLLANLIADFPRNLTFVYDDERKGATLNLIPDELLLRILRSLDTTTTERFATVCRKARMLSLDSLIWRDFVYLAYKPPQVPEVDAIDAIVTSHAANYRQFYIEHPRLRLDGVYIAVCHYVRRDGAVLSLLANEDLTPQSVIPMLKPSLRMKGFHVGHWQLDGSAVHISNLHSPHDSPPSRYHFQMALALHSKPLGRWNKLEILSYESVNDEGEILPLALRHERPFWFSKVKSYPGYH
ncbi:hypothetical protein V8B97DRAFT_1963109 [Scleroderma yunnanense]